MASETREAAVGAAKTAIEKVTAEAKRLKRLGKKLYDAPVLGGARGDQLNDGAVEAAGNAEQAATILTAVCDSLEARLRAADCPTE